jgi:D-inositol-3-phosphate glycosyltransferase
VIAGAARPRLLAIGDGVHHTGYGRVLGRVLSELRRDFTLCQLATNYHGAPIGEPWPIEPNRERARVPIESLIRVVATFRADAILICEDFWFFGMIRPVLREHAPAARTVVYCPIEWPSYPPDELADLAHADCVVAMTEHGARILRDALTRPVSGGGRAGGAAIPVIPHGVDTAVFRPIGDVATAADVARNRRTARHALFGTDAIDDAFVVLNANRLSPRKRIDLTLAAFARFAQDKGDVRLFLHVGPHRRMPQLVRAIRRLGLHEKLLEVAAEQPCADLADDVLNLVYNACDVGLNTAACEGWGLVAFEHAATGAAQILSDAPVCQELWHEHGCVVAMNLPGSAFPGARPEAATEIAARLEALYRDRERLRERSTAAYRYATASRFDWTAIGRLWAATLRGVLNERKSDASA